MEKLQLKMRMLNVAVTKEMWEGFDKLVNFWKAKGIKDEIGITGSILSAGANCQRKNLADFADRTPEMMKKVEGMRKKSIEAGYDSNKTDINDAFNITI